MPKKRMCDYTDQELVDISKAHPGFKSPSFQFFVNDFLGSTRVLAMTSEAISAYFLLLLIEWNEKDCGLPVENEKLMRFSRLFPEQWANVREIVLEMFFENGGRYFNRRLLEVRVDQILNRERNKQNISKRWSKNTTSIPNTYDRIQSGKVIPVDEDVVVDEDIINNKKEETKLSKVPADIDELMIRTFGRNPKEPEVELSQQWINKWGMEFVFKLYKKATLDGFKNLGTLRDSLDENGNIKPKPGTDIQKKIENSTYQPAKFNTGPRLCDCGCGRIAKMKVGDHPLRQYSVFEKACFTVRIKPKAEESFTQISDALKLFDNKTEGITT